MNILYVPNLCNLLTLSLKCPDHQRTQLVVISRWFWMKELRTPKMRFEKSRSWQFLYYHRHHRRQQRYLHCQVLQRAAGFFAGHNDNYNVSWADAARFLAIDVETHQLLYAGWIIAALFRMINDEKEDPSKPPLPGCNVQFVRWRTRWVLEFFKIFRTFGCLFQVDHVTLFLQADHREHFLPSVHPPPPLRRLHHRDRRPCPGTRLPLWVESGRVRPMRLLHAGGDHSPTGDHP